MAGPQPPAIVELPTQAIGQGGALHAAFVSLHKQDWLDAGIVRWLALFEPHSQWPVVVLGAQGHAADGVVLYGTIVGVWAEQPIARFDDLLELPGPLWRDARPAGGYWHFIAVTTHPAHRQLRLGRPLLGAALAFAVGCGALGARTLSPLVGAANLVRALGWEALPVPVRLARLLRRVADANGQPVLPILALHPASGAVVEALLWPSRRDEARSEGATLRFSYPLPAQEREANQRRYKEWLAVRAGLIQAGAATALDQTHWLLPVHDDSWLFDPRIDPQL